MFLFGSLIAGEEEVVDDDGAGRAEDGESCLEGGEDGRVRVEGRIVEFDEITWDANSSTAQGDVVGDFVDGSC